MVMGLKRAEEFLKSHRQISAYLIYADEEGRLQVWKSERFASYLN